jgi:hypothetical protein
MLSGCLPVAARIRFGVNDFFRFFKKNGLSPILNFGDSVPLVNRPVIIGRSSSVIVKDLWTGEDIFQM